jgi:hypothetical protein
MSRVAPAKPLVEGAVIGGPDMCRDCARFDSQAKRAEGDLWTAVRKMERSQSAANRAALDAAKADKANTRRTLQQHVAVEHSGAS